VVELVKCKVVLLGDSAVGKTSLIRRFVQDKFDDKYITTIGTKVTKKEIALTKPEMNVTMMIWDVLGQQGYTSIQAKSYVGTDGVIFVCDLTRRETLDSLGTYWLPELEKVAKGVPAILVGNKVDLQDERKVDSDELERYAASRIWPSFLSSAKTGEKVERAFEAMATAVCGAATRKMAVTAAPKRDVTTLTDAADWLMSDFVDSYGDQEMAMAIVRNTFKKAGLEVSAPTKRALLEAVELLGLAERDFGSEQEVTANLTKRRSVIEGCK
jgi:small GTP-binding protein